MKKTLVAIIIVMIPLFITFFQTGCSTGPSPEELKNAIKLMDIQTKWVSKEYQPWPPKLVLVPAISFKVKNASDFSLTYVNLNAVFRLEGESENLGDSFMAAIRGEPVEPGEKSERILLKSNFGVEGNSVEHFQNNPKWKTAIVELYAQSQGSRYVKLGEREISKKIAFEPPEPVGERKKKEEKKEKKK